MAVCVALKTLSLSYCPICAHGYNDVNLSFKKNVGTRQQSFLFLFDLERLLFLKDGAYFRCCAYVLRISKCSVFYG